MGAKVAFPVFLTVLFAAMLHAGWNTLVKAGTDKLVSTSLIAAGGGIIALPLLFIAPLPSTEAAPYLLASAVIHTAYFTLIGFLYRTADLSVAYPVQRGTAPLLATVLAAIFLAEWPSAPALSGALMLSFGILWLATDGIRKGGLDRRTLLIALSNAGIIALYTLVDGTGGRISGHSVSYNIWLEFLDAVFFLPAAFFVRGKPLARALLKGWKTGLLGGGAAFASYGIAIWAMTEAPIGLVAAVRESSVFFATVFGALFLGESFGRSRYVAAIFVAAGLAALRFG
jgi:drug/metabolite transporter (DMT)-like permease